MNLWLKAILSWVGIVLSAAAINFAVYTVLT